ncbi:MAG: hypothetical protein AB1640_04415 [bacterium]
MRSKRSCGVPAIPIGRSLALLCLVLTLAFPLDAASEEPAPGEDSLLEKLREKGILTEEEVEQLRREGEQERATWRDSLKKEVIPKALQGLSIGTLSYIDFSAGSEKDGDEYNRFRLTRGYINVKKQLTPWLAFRVTPDVTQDDTGDWKLRLKYLYAQLMPPDVVFATDMNAEIGMGHMPWLDFEEHINPYRVQGTMFIERAGIFNSADLGVSLMGNLGGQLGKEYQESVSKYYAGRYGSWHVGVYNGPGYHAKENNGNKVPEYRLTVRPLPDWVPGLQVTYFGLYGQGNTAVDGDYPEYLVHLGMLSYQNEWLTCTGQYARTKGNQRGSFVDAQGQALRTEGYSLFLEGKLPIMDKQFSLFGRYDHFDPDTKDRVTSGDDAYDIALGGLGWEFYHHCMAILAYEHIWFEKNSAGVAAVPAADGNLDDDHRVQVALQIEF